MASTTAAASTLTAGGSASLTDLPALKLVAFDLDGTVWDPEMYQLWGGGSPFRKIAGGKLADKAGQEVYLLGNIPSLMHDLHTSDAYKEVKVAWVSCCDEPNWAAECLSKFETSGGVPLEQVAHSSQIYKDNKQAHFRKLKQEFPLIEFSEMLFFDNEPSNITNVKKLGVQCVLCPDGVTQSIWDKGLALFKK